jgi:hypothetical protein
LQCHHKDIVLGHGIERKKLWLRPEQKVARLKFARAHIHWTEEDWKQVVWSDANQGFKWVWRYPEWEYKEDCCRGTVISGFKKVKVWGAMRYGWLSKLIVVPERVGGRKMDSHDYVEHIMDGEIFDFWMESNEGLGQVVMMEDGARYHQKAANARRKQLEEDGWIG